MQTKTLGETAEPYRDLNLKNIDRKLQNSSELSTALISEAAGLENINSSLLDLTKHRFDHFMNSVKQFIGTSSKLADHVSTKSFDAKVALDKFKSQRSVIEKSIVQIVSSLPKS